MKCDGCGAKLETDTERQTELCVECFEEEMENYLRSEN